MVSAGVIGFGYWGPNLVRNLAETGRIANLHIADRQPHRREEAKRQFPTATVVADYRDLLGSHGPDAIAVATSLASHFEIAADVLKAGRHVLIEKPIAATVDEACRLIDLAGSNRVTLMVDHTLVFAPAVERLADAVRNGELGAIHYFDSVRANLGLFQYDTNVLWDLAVHDVAIMHHVLPDLPTAVSATGIGNIPNHPENVAFMTAFFPGDTAIGHVHANWLAPRKFRQVVLCGARRMAVYNELERVEPLRIYDNGVELSEDPARVREVLIGYRVGDVTAPYLPEREPLRACIEHFLDCVEGGTEPRTGGPFALAVLETVAAADRSLRRRGQAVEISRTRL